MKRLTPAGGHFFFGYYDLQPWNGAGDRHLCHRVAFMDRLPRPEDVARVGFVEPATGRLHEVAETTAWNFQQGAMLQWHPAAPDGEIIFNVREGGQARGCVLRLADGRRRLLERPVATVSPKGDLALSVSFGRLFGFRPGYGYAGVADPAAGRNRPDDEGVFAVDLATGSSRLLLPLAALWDLTRQAADPGDWKLLVNHITWNTDGTRFVLLLRYHTGTAGRPGGDWRTAVLTAAADGSAARVLLHFSYASHYHWRDPRTLALHCEGPEGRQLYEIDEQTCEFRAIDPGFFLRDGHCSWSPDGSRMLYDSYPDARGFRRLWVYGLRQRAGREIASLYSPPHISGDIRCDLHPRWDRLGRGITLDSVHDGFRAIYRIDEV